MSALTEYVYRHTVSGPRDGAGIDMVFFGVSLQDAPDADELKQLIAEHHGDWTDCNPLDGGEHSYTELGAWIGDQGMALLLMGMGAILGIWGLMTPKSVFGDTLSEEQESNLAGIGLITIQVRE